MKKLLFVLLLLATAPLILRADPPKKVTVTYNNETKKLNVVAQHPVKNANTHFIYLFTISVNGKEVKEIKLKKQADAKNATIEASVPEIVSGCKVTVKASCNKFGSKSKSIDIE